MRRFSLTLMVVLLGIVSASAQPATTQVTPYLLTYPFVAPGEIVTTASTTSSAGLNIPQGVAPTSPVNGDIWTTAAGLFIRTGGSTAGPIGTGGLIVNGTPVTGATAGQVLYSDGTKLQAYSITGNGSVVLQTSPTFAGTVGGANTIPLSVLQQSAANTMLGNWSNSPSNVLANTIPSCPDSGSNHLNYVSGAGMVCGTSGGGGASYVWPVRIVTAAGAVTATTSDGVIVLRKTVPATTTVNLPNSPTTGEIITVKDGSCNAGTYNITVTPFSGNIDNRSSAIMNVNCQSMSTIYDGSQWDIQ